MGAKIKSQNLKIASENKKMTDDGRTICPFALVAPATKIQSMSDVYRDRILVVGIDRARNKAVAIFILHMDSDKILVADIINMIYDARYPSSPAKAIVNPYPHWIIGPRIPSSRKFTRWRSFRVPGFLC